MTLERITITLETLTAVFAHVQPEGDARWRAAPFRGLARWWFRAVTGAAKPPDQVRQDEAALFGTAERSSHVAFRVFPEMGGAHSSRIIDADINPGSRNSAKRKAIAPGGRAVLEIVPTRRDGDGMRDLHRAYAALWVALHLGGLGQRSRRGAGSIRIVSVAGAEAALPAISVRDARQYALELQAGLREVRKLLGATALRAIRGDADAEYPVLHPSCADVRVCAPPWPVAEQEARRALMDVRRHEKFHASRRREYEFGGVNPRLASPLWVRIASLNPSVVVLTLFKHRAAGALGAQWDRARDLMAEIDRDGIRVDLDGGGRA